MLKNKVLLLSNETKLNHNFFDGYAFSGSDLICGNKGFYKYIAEGNSFESEADGNYLKITVTETETTISRDNHGFYPIFYSIIGDKWVISNSFVAIFEELKSKSIDLHLNIALLQSWNSDLALTLQASSFDTFIDEIKLLPSTHYFKVINNRLHVLKIQKKEFGNYISNLNSLLKNWRSRINTILNNNLFLRVDLTGGVDSRSVFSFFAHDNLIQRSIRSGNLMIFSDKRHKEDYCVAEEIAKLLDFQINTPFNKCAPNTNQTANEQLTNWINFNISRYSSFVVPPDRFNSNKIFFGGEGGEELRYFYGYHSNPPITNFSDYLTIYKPYFSKDVYFEEWLSSIKTSIKILKQNWSNVDDSIIHYREFRSNHHTNKAPRTQFKFGILSSKDAWNLALSSKNEDFERNQILFDVINSNNYKLMHIPYDSEDKKPTFEAIRYLTQLKVDYSGYGSTFIDDSQIDDDYFRDERAAEIDIEEDILKSLIRCFDLTKMRDQIIDLCGERFYNKCVIRKKELSIHKGSYNIHAKGSFLHNLFIIKYLINRM